MDTDILTQKIRARFDHNQARKVLKEKYTAKMFFACSGGMWKAGPELLNVLAVLKPLSQLVLNNQLPDRNGRQPDRGNMGQ